MYHRARVAPLHKYEYRYNYTHTFQFPVAGEKNHVSFETTWLARPNLLFNWTLGALPDSPTICPSWIWVALSLYSGVLVSPCLKSWILQTTTKKPRAYVVYRHVNPHSVHLISCAAKQSEAHTLYRCQIFLLFTLFTWHLRGLFIHLRSTFAQFLTKPARTHTHIQTGDIIPRGNKFTEKSTCFWTQ
jgi:hypothetical protein